MRALEEMGPEMDSGLEHPALAAFCKEFYADLNALIEQDGIHFAFIAEGWAGTLLKAALSENEALMDRTAAVFFFQDALQKMAAEAKVDANFKTAILHRCETREVFPFQMYSYVDANDSSPSTPLEAGSASADLISEVETTMSLSSPYKSLMRMESFRLEVQTELVRILKPLFDVDFSPAPRLSAR
eukprot:ANDGO_01356.mRNA.1 hypothetical protein